MTQVPLVIQLVFEAVMLLLNDKTDMAYVKTQLLPSQGFLNKLL